MNSRQPLRCPGSPCGCIVTHALPPDLERDGTSGPLGTVAVSTAGDRTRIGGDGPDGSTGLWTSPRTGRPGADPANIVPDDLANMYQRLIHGVANLDPWE